MDKAKTASGTVFNIKRSLDAGAELGRTGRFPKQAPRGHASQEKFLDFNSPKSPHWNVLIMEVCMMGINLETLYKVKAVNVVTRIFDRFVG